jgi:hypothetical protein
MKVKSFYQEKHDKDKEPSMDIQKVIEAADKGEVDQQPATTFHSPVLATHIQPEVSNCKAEQDFCYPFSGFCHLFMNL